MTKISYYLLIGLSALFLFISPVNAEIQTLKSNTRLQEVRRETRIEIKEKIASQRAELKTKIINQVKETRVDIKEKIASQRAELKIKIAYLKDEKKAALITRIDEKLVSMNKKQTGQMNLVLLKLENILNNLSEKADAAKVNGQNTSEVELAITKAQSSLSASQIAVSTQSAKIYIPTINKEDNLKADIGFVVKKMEADLRVTHQTVVNAKKAVQNAAKELEKLILVKVNISPSIKAQ